MKVVILAGGLGTRLQEETVSRPKPMVEIGGRPILWHIMHIYAAHGFREFVIALGYKAEVVRSYFLHYHYLGRDFSINLADGDELVAARLLGEGVDILLVSRKGMSLRFTADDAALRPMGRATSGVKGMSFREGDELLSMNVVRPGTFVFTATDGGYAKRTRVDEYRVQGRGGLGIKVAKLAEARGDLAGALIVEEDDEVLVVLASGKVVRSSVAEVPAKGRDTMGVVFARFADDDRIIAVAKNSERNLDDQDQEAQDDETPVVELEAGKDEAVDE